MDSQVLLLVFALDDRRYALRLSQVQRVILAVDATPIPDAPDTVLGVINVRGTLIPVFNTRRRFGIAERAIEPGDHFIIAEARRRTVALAADGVDQVVECAADQLFAPSAILNQTEMVTGAVQLSDGLVLIHDLDQFLSLDEHSALEAALQVGQR